MVKKKLKFDEVSGNVFNLGSKEKNIASARRGLVNKGFKGSFKISVSKTPRKSSKSVFVKFKAVRPSRRR